MNWNKDTDKKTKTKMNLQKQEGIKRIRYRQLRQY